MQTKALAIVIFVWGIIIYQFISYMFQFAAKAFQQNLFLFIIIIPAFVVIVTLLCISYYKAIYTQPGTPTYHINAHYGQQLQEIKNNARKQAQTKKQRRKHKKKGQVDLDQITSLNKISFCFKCDLVKESRVHHCRICKKCIMRMDHHCPWVGNCVGKMNHKYFILFLFYATTGLTTVWISVLIDYFTGSYYVNLYDKNSFAYYNFYFMGITSLMLASSIGFLFVTQMMTACKNLTTLQNFTQGIQQRNPWDRDSYKDNLRQIFGYSNWILPTNPFPQSIGSSSASFTVQIDGVQQ